MKHLKFISLVGLIFSMLPLGASEAPYKGKARAKKGEMPPAKELADQEEKFRSRAHYDEDPGGIWDSYANYWTTSAEVQMGEGKVQEDMQRAQEVRRARRKRGNALETLQTYLNESQFRDLRTNNAIDGFTLGMLSRLDQLEETIVNLNNNKDALREIAEAKAHLESVQRGTRKLDTNEQREQFRNRLQRFIDAITRLVNQLR